MCVYDIGTNVTNQCVIKEEHEMHPLFRAFTSANNQNIISADDKQSLAGMVYLFI